MSFVKQCRPPKKSRWLRTNGEPEKWTNASYSQLHVKVYSRISRSHTESCFETLLHIVPVGYCTSDDKTQIRREMLKLQSRITWKRTSMPFNIEDIYHNNNLTVNRRDALRTQPALSRPSSNWKRIKWDKTYENKHKQRLHWPTHLLPKLTSPV